MRGSGGGSVRAASAQVTLDLAAGSGCTARQSQEMSSSRVQRKLDLVTRHRTDL